jgi:hypothetical protein
MTALGSEEDRLEHAHAAGTARQPRAAIGAIAASGATRGTARDHVLTRERTGIAAAAAAVRIRRATALDGNTGIAALAVAAACSGAALVIHAAIGAVGQALRRLALPSRGVAVASAAVRVRGAAARHRLTAVGTA